MAQNLSGKIPGNLTLITAAYEPRRFKVCKYNSIWWTKYIIIINALRNKIELTSLLVL